MIVLDTNVLSELMRPSPDQVLTTWLTQQTNETFGTTSVTVMEISFGLARLPAGRRRSDLVRRFDALIGDGDGLRVLELEEQSARIAGFMQAQRQALGTPSSQADMMIAGICQQFSAALATRNVRDFDNLGLTVVNPFRHDVERP